MLTAPADETDQAMDRSAKVVISDLLAKGVTPLLRRHGFDRRGRTYDRGRDGRRELINVEPDACNRFGGSFTINLGIFIPEVDAVLQLYPLPVPPQESECHVRCRIGNVGPDGQVRVDDYDGTWSGWWSFDARTDLDALGDDVRHRVEQHGLRFFEYLSTRDGLVAWLRRHSPTSVWVGLSDVALAVYAGEPALAQESLDALVASADSGPNRLLREAARVAGRLGLAAPALTDTPALTIVCRVAADTSPQDRYSAFHQLDYKFRQYVELWRATLPLADPARLFHTAVCSADACTVTFYGADPEMLIDRLQRALARLSQQFADVTWQPASTPPAPG